MRERHRTEAGKDTGALTTTPRRGSVLAVALLGSVVLFAVGTLLFAFIWDRDAQIGEDESILIPSICFAVVGALVLSRSRSNRMGWVFGGIAFTWASGTFAIRYSTFGATGGDVPGWKFAAWYQEWYWLPWLFLLLAAASLLFPDGKLPSSRWRPVAWLIAIGVVGLSVAAALDPTLNLEGGGGKLDNPIGISPFGDPDVAPLAFVFLLLLWTSAISSLVALIVRFRRARGEERLQMKWFVYSTVIVLATFIALIFIDSVAGRRPAYLDAVILSLPPLAAGLAILKYRLYDIDLVINKTIVFGALAAFITAVYVAIVVGIGTALGAQDEPNLALSIAATAIVAIAFSPVKDRTERIANRLVYGHRLSPYEVLTDLSRTVATAASPKEVLLSVARAAAQGVNATAASVELNLGTGAVVSEVYPEDAASVEHAVEALTVRHEGQEIGRIDIEKRSTDLTPQDRALLTGLASQAGLALHNAQLALELQSRLDKISEQADELSSSRSRIVSAADDSRERLGVAIAEGPRKDLVELQDELDGVLMILAADSEAAAGRLESLTQKANTTLDALRELARGIYPPLLADKGLVSALEAHIEKYRVAVEMYTSQDLSGARFDQSVETTAFFCCIELLRTAGSGATLRLDLRDESLILDFENLAVDADTQVSILDRVDAMDGSVETVGSGQVSTLRLTFPVRAFERIA